MGQSQRATEDRTRATLSVQPRTEAVQTRAGRCGLAWKSEIKRAAGAVRHETCQVLVYDLHDPFPPRGFRMAGP